MKPVRIQHLGRCAVFLACSILLAPYAQAAEAKRFEFGHLADGTVIQGVELHNGSGASARIITLGATLQSLATPDRNGASADIVLGYADPQSYLDQPQYFGATVGRYANRIAGGRFSLDGKNYALETNDGLNHLHGGEVGLDKVVWSIESVESGATAAVTLAYTSAAGEGGYPGTLKMTARYALSDDNQLTIEYTATTDATTIVNITNHSYFNLAGESGTRDVLDHELTLYADYYTPVDATLIPTGERRPVRGTPFDFRAGEAIGSRIRDGGDEQIRFGRGYDHNFVLQREVQGLQAAAKLVDPVSGRVLEILTTAPAIQFYSGNFLDATTMGKSGRLYRQGDALCLEPQVYPDAPNQPDFPSARLEPGESYRNLMVFRFSTL